MRPKTPCSCHCSPPQTRTTLLHTNIKYRRLLHGAHRLRMSALRECYRTQDRCFSGQKIYQTQTAKECAVKTTFNIPTLNRQSLNITVSAAHVSHTFGAHKTAKRRARGRNAYRPNASESGRSHAHATLWPWKDQNVLPMCRPRLVRSSLQNNQPTYENHVRRKRPRKFRPENRTALTALWRVVLLVAVSVAWGWKTTA